MDNSINYNEILILDLSNKSLTELPLDISKYSNLEELNLSNNKLTKLPEFLGDLKNLVKLNLSKNQLTKLPDSLNSLAQLKELNISKNSFTILPDFFRSFKDLIKVDISYNPLKNIPFGLWKLDKLRNLNISGLRLDEIPVEIGNLSKLEVLKLNKSRITTFPETIGYLKGLQEFYLENNYLEKLPKNFSKITELQKVGLGTNKFKDIPKVIFELKNLSYIDVSNNLITKIPKEIGGLQEINSLNISKNKIRTIPVALYELKKLKLKDFNFEDNLLSRVFLKEIKVKFTGVTEKSRFKRDKKYEGKPKKTRTKISYNYSGFKKLFLPLSILVFIPFFLYLFYIYDKTTKFNEKQQLLKKHSKDYKLAKENLEASMQRMLNKTEEVFVYTNDKAKLNMTIHANTKFNEIRDEAKYTDEDNAKCINGFLKNKRSGYIVRINSREKKFTQMWLHDSVIPRRFPKKFRVTRYYKMTPEEVIYNKERDKKRISYFKKPRRDKVYAINRGIVDFKELQNRKFTKKTRKIFTPQNIDLTRKENYFYFSSLNANVSEKEFLEAVENFKEMFITKGNPDKFCVIKKVKVLR